jgi:hypothetical protein
MLIQTKTPSQGLLFSEPLYSETGVWVELNPGIEPEEWASLCRYIGNMGQKEFKKCKKTILPSPDSLKSRLKRLFTFNGSNLVGIPILSVGPSGINGEFQREG